MGSPHYISLDQESALLHTAFHDFATLTAVNQVAILICFEPIASFSVSQLYVPAYREQSRGEP